MDDNTCYDLGLSSCISHDDDHIGERVKSGLVMGNTKLSKTNNRIKIDKGTYLAKNPNHLNKDWLTNNKTGNSLLDEQSKGLFQYLKVKPTQAKIKILDMVLANLLSAYSTQSQLLYSRDTAEASARVIIKVVDYLEHERLVINVIGKSNEYEGNTSWLVPTDKLKAKYEAAKVRVELSKDAAQIIVRAADGKPMSLQRIKTRQPAKLRHLSNPVNQYNRIWLDHEATLFDKHLVPFCRRIFNTSLLLGGRFYGASHLSLPSDKRAMILIDGEATVEPDFKSLHYCLLYAKAGQQLNTVIDDPYLIDGFTRKTIKLSSLVLMNSNCMTGFKAMVTKSGNPSNKLIMANYNEEYERYILRSGQGLKAKRPTKPKIANGFIEGMPDGIKGDCLFNAIKEKHSDIAHLFGVENIGLESQFKDSEIMASVLSELSILGIPALPVHDSLRCKISNRGTVVRCMEEAYLNVVGFKGYVT